jgi:hypothetical protein
MAQLDPMIQEALSIGLDTTYKEVGEGYGLDPDQGFDPETVHEQRLCRMLTVSLMLELEDRGVKSVRPDSRRGWNVDEHRYLVLDIDGEEIIVDPSWQQFLPQELRTEDLPRALVGTREEVMEQAFNAGVNPIDTQLWAPKGVYDEPENLTREQRIARAIDSAPPAA